jgi:hypothetical protein
MVARQPKENAGKSMNEKHGPDYYEILVQGQLDSCRSSWFEGMTLKHIENVESGSACTLISGPVIDQPALHGLLTKIRDLNLTLISIRRVFPGAHTVEDDLTSRNSA